ncbi:MAG: ABC transporter permease [Gammaproteobacteria bacterium]|nr:ABC transporter permease [Gammaproteobacteria bacterium]NVK87341.1 ABC transporter permease [Gammaproteobacteria bacterium]
MFNFKRFSAIFKSRNLEFWRDRSALSWNLIFPLLLIIGMAVVFDRGQPVELKVGLLNTEQAPAFTSTIKYTEFVHYNSFEAAMSKVTHHQIDMLIDVENQEYYVNSESSKGYLAKSVLSSAIKQYQEQAVEGKAVRYVDWVVPGILGMNIMFSSLFGVGYVIVRYRKNGVLKRISTTPITALEFVGAQLVSRLMIVVLISASVFLATWFTIDFLVLGNLFLLLLILLLGTMSLISLGLLVASRLQSEELTGGLLNMASWPMMLLSGVWFSLEGAPVWVQQFAQLLPLTHLVEAARSVMIDGAVLADVSHHLFALSLMSVLFLTLGAKLFSWGNSR